MAKLNPDAHLEDHIETNKAGPRAVGMITTGLSQPWVWLAARLKRPIESAPSHGLFCFAGIDVSMEDHARMLC